MSDADNSVVQMEQPSLRGRTMRAAHAWIALTLGTPLLISAGSPPSSDAAIGAQQLRASAILFVSDREGYPATALYTVNSDGRGLRRLIGGVSSLEGGQWSPDGRMIAFKGVSGVSTPTGIYVVDGGGRRPRRLTEGRGLTGGGFSWSPDGTTIAYSSVDGIFSIRVRGREPVRLTNSDGPPIDSNPTWSPDGKRIAFVRSEEKCATTCSGLWVMDANGSHERRLVGGELSSVFGKPSWSPDSRRLVFHGRDGKDNAGFKFSVFVINTTGGRGRRVVGDAYLSPVWSPRGDEIALTGTFRGQDGLFLVHPDGHDLRRLSALRGWLAPTWSPDGRALALASGVLPSVDLYVVDATNGRTRRITQGSRYGYWDASPQWNPRGLATERLGGTRVSPEVPTDSIVEGEMLKTRQPVDLLAVDGSRAVAAYRQARPNCIESWDPQARSLIRFHAGYCALHDLGVAGDRIAWVTYDGGSHGTSLWTALHAEPPRKLISGVCDTHVPGPPIPCSRLAMFDLKGDGSLYFDTWYTDCRDWILCLGAPKRSGKLWRLDGVRAVEIASSERGLTPLSIDDGRILVDRGEGILELLTANGSSLRTFQLNAELVRGARLQGRDLVVLTPKVVEVTDAETGAFLRRWPAPSGARLEDVQDGVAVLVVGTDVHLLGLADGRTAVIRTPGSGPMLAQLEPSGLFYSYRVEDARFPGRVAFIPFDRLPLR